MKKETIFKIFILLILVLIIVMTSIYVLNLNTEIIENYNFYQYIAGRKIEYEGSLKMTNKEGVTELTCNNISIQLDSTPIYYRDIENQVIFPEDMIIVIPNENGQVYKINRFSNIYIKGNVPYIEFYDKIKELTNAFIFDGGDLYFFISNATIEIDEETYEITPLSYVYAYNQNRVEIYNKQTDEYKIIETENQAIVTTEDYTINVSLDTIKYGEKEQLLLKKFEELQTIKLD